MTRAAPAKNRKRSTQTVISSIAAPTGLPAFWLSRRPELVGPSLEGVRELEQEQAAVLRRGVLVGLEGRVRGVDRAVDVLLRRCGDLGDDLPLAGILDVERLAARDSTNSPPMNWR